MTIFTSTGFAYQDVRGCNQINNIESAYNYNESLQATQCESEFDSAWEQGSKLSTGAAIDLAERMVEEL